MKHSDFTMGLEFRCGPETWRVTDIGTRTVVAIRVSTVHVGGDMPMTLDREAAESMGWFRGPPFAVAEVVFDENDFEGCECV